MSRMDYKPLPVSEIGEGYHDLDFMSYSRMKQFVSDRKMYRDLYVVRDDDVIEAEKERRKKSPFIRMGNLVDVRITDAANFNKMFVVCNGEVPTGQMLTLVNYLIGLTDYEVTDEGDVIIKSDFGTTFENAYELLKDSNGGKLQSGIAKFVERFPLEGEAYYRDRLRSAGRTVISEEELQISESIANALLTSDNTKDIFGAEHTISKFGIIGKIQDEDVKMELDWGVFDHEKKTLQPYDLKCVTNVEGFVWDSYLIAGYYIQGGVYVHLLRQWLKEQEGYEGYTVKNMKFIVCDQKND